MESKHIEKVRELAEEYARHLVDDAAHLIGSGAINIESFEAENYRLAKCLLTAAIYRTRDDYMPPGKDLRRTITLLACV